MPSLSSRKKKESHFGKLREQRVSITASIISQGSDKLAVYTAYGTEADGLDVGNERFCRVDDVYIVYFQLLQLANFDRRCKAAKYSNENTSSPSSRSSNTIPNRSSLSLRRPSEREPGEGNRPGYSAEINDQSFKEWELNDAVTFESPTPFSAIEHDVRQLLFSKTASISSG